MGKRRETRTRKSTGIFNGDHVVRAIDHLQVVHDRLMWYWNCDGVHGSSQIRGGGISESFAANIRTLRYVSYFSLARNKYRSQWLSFLPRSQVWPSCRLACTYRV